MTVPVPATLEVTVTAPGPATQTVQAGTVMFGRVASTFSYDFTVPADDVVLDDGVKFTFDVPNDGMFAISLFDLGVIGDPAKVSCSVYSNNYGVRYTNFTPFATSGVFAGSAPEDDELTITVHGPWNVEWE